MRTQGVPSKKGDLPSTEEARDSLGKGLDKLQAEGTACVRLPGKKGPAVFYGSGREGWCGRHGVGVGKERA